MKMRIRNWFGRDKNKASEPAEEPVDVPDEGPEPSSEDEQPPLPEAEPSTLQEETHEVASPEQSKGGFLSRLKKRLSKTRSSLLGGVDRLFQGKKALDDDLLDDLEELLITSDLGVQTTMDLMDSIRASVSRKDPMDADALRGLLQERIQGFMDLEAAPMNLDHRPSVLLVVGVNGVGKTTTIGKLALSFKAQGKSVLLAAADTFRAAAVEQLEIWAERAGCPIVKQKSGSDPSAVAFDAIEAAQARGVDLVIVDTAGRLHTQKNLMEQMKKIQRVIARKIEGAPHEVFLVLDATTGQNALAQARLFHEALGVTGFILTKLDGTAKGGIVVAITREMGIPIRYIGIGESIDDLRPFQAREFADALFKE